MPAGKVNEPPMTASLSIGEVGEVQNGLNNKEYSFFYSAGAPLLSRGQAVIFDVKRIGKKLFGFREAASNVRTWDDVKGDPVEKGKWKTEWDKLKDPGAGKRWARELRTKLSNEGKM